MFLLQETHIVEEKVDRFKKFFKSFKLFFIGAKKEHRYGRASGGSIFGIKTDLHEKGIRFNYDVRGETVIIQIKNRSEAIEIYPLYIRGANWTHEFSTVRDYFDQNEVQRAIIMGDINVRIGGINQILSDSDRQLFLNGFDQRNSKDQVTNSNGKKFIDFCNDFGLVVLNGRTNGDAEGAFTFLNNVGQSVNDICTVTTDLLQNVDSFCVENQTWSDHFPIVCCVFLGENVEIGKKNNLLPKLKWRNEKCAQYRHCLNVNLERSKTEKDELQLKDMQEIIKKSNPQGNKRLSHFEAKNRWFNSACETQRRKTLQALRAFKRSDALQDKENYLKFKQQYAEILKKAKTDYYKNLEDKLRAVNNNKDWWQVAREIRGQKDIVNEKILTTAFKAHFADLLNPEIFATDIQYAQPWISCSELDRPVTPSEIRKALSKVKINKAPGEDRIPYEFIINATDDFIQELAKIFDRMYNRGEIDEVFVNSIILPIFKKGSPSDPKNYRGISFMNCIAKIFMSILNDRLYEWLIEKKILNEYQAGFRKKYSTMDNVFNLASIVHLKFDQKKKVYAFFVDFKAAFDKVSRHALIYKLHAIGVSSKFVKFVESVYSNTHSAIWTGVELSDSFETKAGVKQGCLLSPLLFSIYLNDLHDFLEEGLRVEGLEVRLLLYADDIVMLADDPMMLQRMINRLEKYCQIWNMEVNTAKSEIMVFRKAGKLGKSEKWTYIGEPLRITSEYTYLGVLLTPKFSFSKHLDKRNEIAKCCINETWKHFVNKPEVSLQAKWQLFQAVCRAKQCYGAQVWGYGFFEVVNKLQRYFLKRVLRLPPHTPNYALALETGTEDGHIYSLQLHLQYLTKIRFQYEDDRLPKQLMNKLFGKELFCVPLLNSEDRNSQLHLSFDDSEEIWNQKCKRIIEEERNESLINKIRRADASTSLYRFLDYSRANEYFQNLKDVKKITWVMKARCNLIKLNGNQFDTDQNNLCTLCNLREKETLVHFLGICPILREFRFQFFGKSNLSDDEVVDALDGRFENGWCKLANYIKISVMYREELIREFN